MKCHGLQFLNTRPMYKIQLALLIFATNFYQITYASSSDNKNENDYTPNPVQGSEATDLENKLIKNIWFRNIFPQEYLDSSHFHSPDNRENNNERHIPENNDHVTEALSPEEAKIIKSLKLLRRQNEHSRDTLGKYFMKTQGKSRFNGGSIDRDNRPSNIPSDRYSIPRDNYLTNGFIPFMTNEFKPIIEKPEYNGVKVNNRFHHLHRSSQNVVSKRAHPPNKDPQFNWMLTSVMNPLYTILESVYTKEQKNMDKINEMINQNDAILNEPA